MLKIFRLPPRLMLLTTSIYISQYLGVSFIFAAGVVVMRQSGMGLDKLALLNLVALPAIGKIIYASIIDQYKCYFKGQYRSWLLLSQGLMCSLLVIMSSLNYITQFIPLMVCLTLYALAVAIQDVSVDGLSCKIFNKEQRKYINSIQFSSNLLGNIIGGGVLLITYPYLEWKGSLLVLSALTAISWIQLLFYVEPDNKDKKHKNIKLLFKACFSFAIKYKYWFILLFIYPFGMNGAFTILKPMLVDVGWSVGDIGFVVKVYGSLVGVLSALSAPFIIKRFGGYLTLRYLTSFLIIGLCTMLPITVGYTSAPYVYLAVTTQFAAFPALLTTFGTLIMDNASKYPNRATIFTLQFSCISLMSYLTSTLFMGIAKKYGYQTTVLTGICFVIIILFLLKPLLKRSIFKYENSSQ